MTVIRLAGKGIREGSIYLPIRHLAGRIAATAPPKNYYAQIRAVYDAITRDLWRYTYDPVGAEVLTVKPQQTFTVTLGGGKSNHRGYGDCDDITIAGGALLSSIGMHVRIATTSLPNSPNVFDHIFLFVKPPRATDWVCFDPVLYPHRKFGDITNYQRLALWSLNGDLIKKIGPFPPRFDAVMKSYGRQAYGFASNFTGTETEKMTQQNPNYHDFYDYSDEMGAFEPMRGSSASELPDFSIHGILGFGGYAETMGYMTGEQVPHMMSEVDESDQIGNTGLVRTKHFEMDPADYAYMVKYGSPKSGALALSDDGELYAWQQSVDGYGGLFKRLARRVKRRVKKIGRGIKRGIKRVGRGVKSFAKRIAKTKVFRLGKRMLKSGIKLVKPFLKKYGGKIMKAIAPIAAVIPGVGPVLSTALVIGGQAIDMAQKLGIKFDKNKIPIFPSMKTAQSFRKGLINEAKKLGKKGAQQILRKFEKSRGISGGDDEIGMINAGINMRTRPFAGFGWV